MKAMVYQGNGQIALETVPDPKIIEPTDAIVQVDLTTICGSDLHILGGHVPTVEPGRVIGHEAVGTVLEVGSATTSVSPGDKVLVSGITTCGRCNYCRKRMFSQCRNGGWMLGNTLHGAQAELLRAPFADNTLYKVPDGLTDQQVLFLDDPVITAYEVGLQRAEVTPGQSVAVIGVGAIGLSLVILAPLFGAGTVIAVDTDDNRLELARRLGADVTVNARTQDARAAIINETDGDGVDVAVECVGSPATFAVAADVLRPGGCLANIGVHGEPVQLALDRLWIRNITITTGLVDINELPTLLNLVATGRLDVTALASHNLSLSEGEKAYEIFTHAADHGALKVTLAP
jgi:alcohol dehydrogenase